MVNKKPDYEQGPETETFNFQRRLPLLAALIASTFLTAGCLSSGSSDDTIADPVDDPVDDPVVESSFKVDFMAGAPTVTWGEVETITAFRPAQASYEYLADSDTHTGAGAFAGFGSCGDCHDTNANNPSQVGAERDEEELTPSKETVPITVQAAYDADNFYLKASWETERPGITHDIWRYDGAAWNKVSVYNEPGNEPDEAAGERFSAEDRFAAMFMPASQDVSVGASFHEAGCFATCHEDMDDMPEWPVDEPATAKYLLSGTSANGTYDTSSESNADVLAGTTASFPDMWHFRGARSAIINTVTDGYVMDSRANDDGSNFYATQDPDEVTGELEWMYDPAWMADFIAEHAPDYEGETNVSAISDDLWEALEQNAPTLVLEGPNANAVAFDAAEVNEGDIIPRRILTPQDNSRTDVNAYSAWEDGTWTVIFERARDTGNPDDHVLNPGAESYSFAFAAHQENTVHRWHHVTFPVTLGMEGSGADIEAKLN